jgi:hypothetical protein
VERCLKAKQITATTRQLPLARAQTKINAYRTPGQPRTAIYIVEVVFRTRSLFEDNCQLVCCIHIPIPGSSDLQMPGKSVADEGDRTLMGATSRRLPGYQPDSCFPKVVYILGAPGSECRRKRKWHVGTPQAESSEGCNYSRKLN